MQLILVLLCGVGLVAAALEFKKALDEPEHAGAAYFMAGVMLIAASAAAVLAAIYIQRML